MNEKCLKKDVLFHNAAKKDIFHCHKVPKISSLLADRNFENFKGGLIIGTFCEKDKKIVKVGVIFGIFEISQNRICKIKLIFSF